MAVIEHWCPAKEAAQLLGITMRHLRRKGLRGKIQRRQIGRSNYSYCVQVDDAVVYDVLHMLQSFRGDSPLTLDEICEGVDEKAALVLIALNRLVETGKAHAHRSPDDRKAYADSARDTE